MKNLILLLCLLLTACAHPTYVATLPPSPTIPPEPDYPIYHLSAADKGNYGKVSNAPMTSLAMCIADDKKLRALLEGYVHE